MPTVANITALRASFRAASSLSRAARYAPTGVSVKVAARGLYILLSSRPLCRSSEAILRARAVSAPEPFGSAMIRVCFPSDEIIRPCEI